MVKSGLQNVFLNFQDVGKQKCKRKRQEFGCQTCWIGVPDTCSLCVDWQIPLHIVAENHLNIILEFLHSSYDKNTADFMKSANDLINGIHIFKTNWYIQYFVTHRTDWVSLLLFIEESLATQLLVSEIRLHIFPPLRSGTILAHNFGTYMANYALSSSL